MPMQRVYDVSITIKHDMLVWTGNPLLLIDKVKSIAQGNPSDVSLLHIDTYTATNVDALRRDYF